MTGTPSANEARKTSAFQLNVDAGKWTGAELKGLGRGCTLTVQLTADGPVTICLVDEHGYKEARRGGGTLISGETSREFGFTVVLPRTGVYILVADNREGLASRSVDVIVTAVQGLPPEAGPDNYVDLANEMLSVFEAGVKVVFDVDSLRITAGSSSDPNVIVSNSGGEVAIGDVFAKAVFEQAGDRDMAASLMLFAVFQEIGRTLANLTGQDDALTDSQMDELATGLLCLFGYHQHVASVASYFQADANAHRLADLFPGDRHLLSASRARQVAIWASESGPLSGWQQVVLPAMRTSVLQQLKANPQPWLSNDVIDQVLASRGVPEA